MATFLKHFWIDLVITGIALIVALLYGGFSGAITAAILIVLEIVFSFDNAGVNAKYLAKMSHKWRTIFLTVGILVAVFGMRLAFPFIIVWATSGKAPVEAWNLAMERGDPHTPGTYGYILEQAHPMIASFGSMFLLMLFLTWLFDEKEHRWIKPVEHFSERMEAFKSFETLLTLLILLGAEKWLAPEGESEKVLIWGAAGIITFLLTNGLATFMETKNEERESELAALGQTALLTGKAAFSMFVFLEVLDASFSFDGVLGAFAITSDPIIIALGLGVGALYVRSITIYLVDQGTLQEYRYLENGAHWAIGILAVLLLLTIEFNIPDYVIGFSGLVVILLSLISSRKANKRELATEA